MSFIYRTLVEYFWLASLLFIVILVAGMLGCLELGRRLALRNADSERHDKLLDSVRQMDTTVCALMGLLIAFSFYGAATRFYERERAVMDNVNAVEKTHRQMLLLPPRVREPLHHDLRAYVACRLEIASHGLTLATLEQSNRCEALQYALIDKTVSLMDSNQDALGGRSAVYLTFALSDMAATWTAHKMAVQRHLHPAVYLLLLEVALVASVLIGYASHPEPRSWLHQGSFALVVMSALYVIIDMEFPRVGLIRITAPEQLLQQLLERMR